MTPNNAIMLPAKDRFLPAKVTNVDSDGNYTWTEVELAGRTYIGSLQPQTGTTARERNNRIVTGGTAGTSGSSSSAGGFPFFVLLHLEELDGLNEIWVFDAPESNSTSTVSSGAASGSASAQTNSFDEEKEQCVGGVSKRYRRTVTLSGGLFSATEWTFIDTQGCCACPSSGTASGSSSGVSGSGTASATGGGGVACCGRELNATLYASIPGEGTIVLTWTGASYWTGSKALSCGETLYLRFSNCVLEYACIDSGPFYKVPPSSGSDSCVVSFVSKSYSIDMNSDGAGCIAGSCGTFSPVVVQE